MAYNPDSLSEQLMVSNTINRSLLAKWNSIRDLLLEKHIATTVSVSVVDAEKFKFDLHGLFKFSLNMADYEIYPHMIVNGYTSSTDYNGELLRFKIINSNTLNTYYRMFLRS